MKINIVKLKQFIKDWAGKGNEKQHTSRFWLEFLEALGVSSPTKLTEFEKPVKVDGSQKYIDVYMGAVKVLVEQKSLGIDLDTKELQSDGVYLTPYEQGKRYSDYLPLSEKPAKIITCNFDEFRIFDMEKTEPEKEVVIVKLEDLEKEAYLFDFLTSYSEAEVKREEEISVKAGNYVKNLYDAFAEQYDPDDPKTARNLNILCVRLVFLFYCEDADIFQKNQFLEFLKASDEAHIRRDLIDLFEVLNTKIADRSKYLPSTLAAFPYCNGGLFAETIEIPDIPQKLIDMMIDASDSFDWRDISPTIFGACFESTLNPETRRSGGMHYTPPDYIHRVIDPLFLDDLKSELSDIIAEPIPKTKEAKLDRYHEKLASLKFLDPACGSGNFLTETYLSLRTLENTVIREKVKMTKGVTEGQIIMGEALNPIKVSIQQMYGIEINDFAVSVAMTALWIAEAQMMKETEAIVAQQFDFLPLETMTNIHEGNSLQMNWEDVVSKYELTHIIGNPPFVGYSYQSEDQKNDMRRIFAGNKKAGKLDYVAAWYKKAADMMENTNIRAAFVSTNSITQGEQVDILWHDLMNDGIHIDFAYKTFKWENESFKSAAVHCVIIGFSSAFTSKGKRLYEDDDVQSANNINGYLIDAPNVFISSRKKPLCDVSPVNKGSQPTDGGNLYLTPDERDEMVSKNPLTAKYIRKVLGAEEFINAKERYCLWLVGADPVELMKCPEILERVEAVREFRSQSKKETTRRDAATPSLFQEIRQPDTDYLIIPRVSSERRKYVPIGYVQADVIANDSAQMVPNATLYEFGILTSGVHMAWMRTVAGRLEMRYRYSNDIVYNNFPWPEPTSEQKAKIEKTAQGILDARAQYPDASLAQMYGENMYLFPELVKAHQANDKAVLEAYGIGPKDPEYHDETACVAMLMKMYQKLTEEK